MSDQQLKLQVSQENQSSKTFYFNKVLDASTTERKLFNEFYEFIKHATDGGVSCILAYGETGSGKTYSIQQLLHSTGEYLSEKQYKIKIQIFEIHNETVKNLLSEEVACTLWDTQSWSIQLPSVWSTRNLGTVIQQAFTKRQHKFKSLQDIYRSHTVTVLQIYNKTQNTNSDQFGTLMLVDLVGTEKIVIRKHYSSDVVKESISINKSLQALEELLYQYQKSSFESSTSYKNSILTRFLFSTLQQRNTKCALLVNLNQASMQQSYDTLQFIKRIRHVSTNFQQLSDQNKAITDEVIKLIQLLEKERDDKHSCFRRIDRLERDLVAYQQGSKDREIRIQQLQQRLKKKDVESSNLAKMQSDLQIFSQENKLLRSQLQFVRNNTKLNTLGSNPRTLYSKLIDSNKKQRRSSNEQYFNTPTKSLITQNYQSELSDSCGTHLYSSLRQSQSPPSKLNRFKGSHSAKFISYEEEIQKFNPNAFIKNQVHASQTMNNQIQPFKLNKMQ